VAPKTETAAKKPRIQDDNGFFVSPLMLFSHRGNIWHESPAFTFDSAGNLHCIAAAPSEYRYGGYPDWYVHLWTNRSSGRIEHHWIEYYDFTGRYLPLFLNMVSGGIDFIYWQYNHSKMATEFFQYSWKPTGAVTTQLLATVTTVPSAISATGNGSHPVIFHLTSHAPLGMNLSVLWPGETEFSFSGLLKGLSYSWDSILDAFLDEKGNLILWVQQDLPGVNRRRILSWCASREAVVCAMNMTITASYLLAMVHSQEGVHWLLTYPSAEVILYRAYADPANGNYSLSQVYQQPLITWNVDIHLGLHGTTPFITFLAASPELGSTVPVLYLGSWTSGGEFHSQALNMLYPNPDELPQVYDPIGGTPGLIIPYILRDVTGYDEDLRKDGKAAYAPHEIKENGLDLNQEIDVIYLATNISGLAKMKPAIFNLREAESSLLSHWPWLVALVVVGGLGSSLGYWYFKRRKQAERLIETLGESIKKMDS
jgi:hypothetical protein